jgi:hypothetical protein
MKMKKYILLVGLLGAALSAYPFFKGRLIAAGEVTKLPDKPSSPKSEVIRLGRKFLFTTMKVFSHLPTGTLNPLTGKTNGQKQEIIPRPMPLSSSNHSE